MKLNPWKMLPLAALCVLTTSAYAQRPGPGGFGGPGGGPGGFQMTPAIQAKMDAWRKWQDNHKNVGTLQRTIGQLTRMEEDPKTKLAKPQAKKVLAVIQKWQGKPALTDVQSKQINAQILASLTPTQAKMIASAPQFGRGQGGGFGGPRPGGMGGPGGGGRPGGMGGPGGRPGGMGGPGGRPGGMGGPGGGSGGPRPSGMGGPGGRPAGMGGPGGGRPGGMGGPGGRRGFDPASMPSPKEFNPLNPATSPMVRDAARAKQRHAQLITALTASAK